MLKAINTSDLIKLVKNVKDLNDIDTSSIISMSELFCGNTQFNKPADSWDVSRVTNISQMFCGAVKYTHSMKNWLLLKKCDTADFLKSCILWIRYNTEDNMPLKNQERLRIPEELKEVWN